MNWKLVACLLGAVLLAVWFLAFGTGGRGGASGRGGTLEAASAGDEALSAAGPAELDGSSAPPPAPLPTPEPERAAAEVQVETSGRAELAGLTGRVVESDGAPVAGIPVALLEFETTLLFDGAAL